MPPDVVELGATFSVGRVYARCGWHLWDPGGAPADAGQLEDVLSAFLLDGTSHLVDVMHAGVRLSDVTAVQDSVRVITGYDFSAGIWDGAQAIGLCHGWHWLDGRGRSSSASLTHLPGLPDAFVEDDGTLSHTGYANLRDKGAAFLSSLASLRTPTLGHYVPVVLHRRRGGHALPVAEPTPIVAVRPMLSVSTINRRMRKTRAVPSA